MTQTIKEKIARLEEALMPDNLDWAMSPAGGDHGWAIEDAARAYLKLLKDLESGEVKIIPIPANEKMAIAGRNRYMAEDHKHDPAADFSVRFYGPYYEMVMAAPEYSFDE